MEELRDGPAGIGRVGEMGGRGLEELRDGQLGTGRISGRSGRKSGTKKCFYFRNL